MSILHTSTIFNLPKIIKDGYLLPKYPDDEKSIPKHINRLETFINTKLPEKESNTEKPKLDMWNALTYEVVFLETIPLHYIDAIIVAPSMVKCVTEYIEKVNEQRKEKGHC